MAVQVADEDENNTNVELDIVNAVCGCNLTDIIFFVCVYSLL